tara:strand:- start:628 stop:1806 length:1179 start_codon:yes stop_codon:yes gene_type:complete
MKPVKINDWTHKKEKLLRFWQEECRLYNWLYVQNTQHYEFVNKSLSITSILLSAVTGTTLINNSDCSNCNDSSINNIVLAFGIITVFNTFLQGAKEFLNLPEKININTNAARQNNIIIMDIDEQINNHPSDRINGKEFLKSIKLRKNELIQNGPVIPKKCWSKLRNKIAKGENINFFNNHIFQEYLDQTININKLDFHEENNLKSNDSSSNNSDTSSNKSNDTYDTINKKNTIIKLNDSIYHNKDNNVYNMNTLYNKTNKNNMENDIDNNMVNNKENDMNNNMNNINNFNLNDQTNNFDKTNISYLSYTSGSEDEFLDDIKNNNMCKQQLEFNLKKNNSINKNNQNNTNNKNNINNQNNQNNKNNTNNQNTKIKKVIPNKFNSKIQYQMSRI